MDYVELVKTLKAAAEFIGPTRPMAAGGTVSAQQIVDALNSNTQAINSVYWRVAHIDSGIVCIFVLLLVVSGLSIWQLIYMHRLSRRMKRLEGRSHERGTRGGAEVRIAQEL